LPATVDTSRFEVGGNLAVTPGSVVLRNGVLELLHYQPQTEQVRETPLLVVPPTINKYYILDLAPGRSLVEYLVAQGQQVFAISWRNPDQEQGHFDLDTYARAISEARDAVADISQADSVHVAGACSGGIVTAGLLGHLAGSGNLGDVASLTLMVCALDNAQAGTVSALATRDVAAAAVAESARKGYVDGQALAGVFTWLRPNDLVWSYVVNNYLLGKEPPAFDILYWNQDTVRMTAGLHRDFIHIGLENSFIRPGALEVLDTPVDMSAVDIDVYAVAGLSDHIVPWENAYRSVQLFGGARRFVLARSGHIQALVNPPAPAGTEARASYRVADDVSADAEGFATQTAKLPGSWWPDWDAWLAGRSGALRRAPRSLGNRRFRAQAKAPGSYVLAS
jgi:poly(3-hydroxyalkanoate) synthetase